MEIVLNEHKLIRRQKYEKKRRLILIIRFLVENTVFILALIENNYLLKLI